MLLRFWEDKDNLEIAQLEKLCFKTPWSFESLKETSSYNNFLGVVAEDNGKVVGYAGIIYAFDQGDIALVAVDPQRRREKIAYNMLNFLFEKIEDKSIKTLYLEVRVSNDGAKALYQKLGFKPCGIRKNYYENTEDAIVMVRE